MPTFFLPWKPNVLALSCKRQREAAQRPTDGA
jgi:hypothetical protein